MDDDIDDEILALAEERKRSKKSSSKGNSRRKSEVELSDSDMDLESEEDDNLSGNLYPLEGKYIDEADRLRLLEMPEIEREEIIAKRLEEIQLRRDAENLARLVKAQKPGEQSDVKPTRGSGKQKSDKFDKYKAERKAKEERKRTKKERAGSPTMSPMKRNSSDDEDEEGQVHRYDDDSFMAKEEEKPEPPVTRVEDLNAVRLTRNALAKYFLAPWFEDFVKGGFVRYMIGNDERTREPIYRICEIMNLGADLVKPYKLNDHMCNTTLELKHGKSTKIFNLDRVSNAPFSDHEFHFFIATCNSEKVKLPSLRDVDRKKAQLEKLSNQQWTESDVTAMIARRAQLQPNKPSMQKVLVDRARLHQARSLAVGRRDFAEVATIDAEILAMEGTDGGKKRPRDEEDEKAELLTKVNQRNRRANVEAVRSAEAAAMERKRLHRRLGLQGGDSSDPSARLKTVPKTFTPRGGTPSTPPIKASTPGIQVPPLPASTLNGGGAKSFDAMLSSVEVDLGDF